MIGLDPHFDRIRSATSSPEPSGNRERFERELHRMRGFRFKRLLIVGNEEDIRNGQYHSQIKPSAVLATLATFEVVFLTNPNKRHIKLCAGLTGSAAR
jgi:hypothetical protein